MKVRVVKTARECLFETPGFETQLERGERQLRTGRRTPSLMGLLKVTMVDVDKAIGMLVDGLDKGIGVKEVAKTMGVSSRTLRRHVKEKSPNFFEELGVMSQTV